MRLVRHAIMVFLVGVLAAALLVLGGRSLVARTAAVAAPAQPAAPPVEGTPPDDSAAAAARVAAATSAVDAVAAQSDAEMGAAVLDRTTGRLAVGDQGATPIYSASVVKLYTVVDLLNRAHQGTITLTGDDRTDIDRALTLSDDDAMDALWDGFGGPDTVTGTIALAGLQDSRPPDDPSQWGETVISARDVVTLYDYVLGTMDTADRDTIMADLRAAADTGADGFDQAFGLIAPPRPDDVAAKQGWMWCGSDLYLHSTGVLPGDRYVVAVLSRGPASAGEDAGRTLVTQAVAAAESALSS